MVKPLTPSELASILKKEQPVPPPDALETETASISTRSRATETNSIKDNWI